MRCISPPDFIFGSRAVVAYRKTTCHNLSRAGIFDIHPVINRKLL